MNRTITRHPDDANLISFAAGALPEPLSAAIAVHIGVCDHCRAGLRTLRALGGALVDDLATVEAAPVSRSPIIPDALSPVAPITSIAGRSAPDGDRVSWWLRRTYGFDLTTVPWRWLGPGVRHCRLPLSAGAEGDLRLLNIAPGRKMPEHGHGGNEMTLVLAGSYHDETGSFGPGDIQDVDGDLEHRPIVGSEGCICLVAAEHPARFKGMMSRLLQPWTRM